MKLVNQTVKYKNSGTFEKNISDRISNKTIDQYSIDIKQPNLYVYHGSTQKGLKKIITNKTAQGENWVYASYSKVLATIFISNKGNDLYYYLSGNGTINNPIILVERKEGMFKDIFNVSGSLYTLSAKNFSSEKLNGLGK